MENEHIFETGMMAALGVIGAAISVVSLYGASRPEGIGIFAGFYLLMVLLPIVLVNGIVLALYVTDNNDYFTAVSADEEFWSEKYGEEVTVEQATADAEKYTYWLGMTSLVISGLLVIMLAAFASLA